MNIYLLRHGQTDWNIEGRFQGRMDIPLNAQGVCQIEKAMEVFAGMQPKVDVILTSPLVRAKKSAEIAAGKLGYVSEDIISEPLFIERSFGEAEGQITAQMWNEDVISQFAGAELQDQICDRADLALQKVAERYSGKNVLVAAHGAILKAVLAAVLGRQEVYEIRKMKLESGCIHRLTLKDGIWKAYKLDMNAAAFKEI